MTRTHTAASDRKRARRVTAVVVGSQVVHSGAGVVNFF
jgi:hypothetical protein